MFAQCADLAGVYGISFLIVFVNAALAEIILCVTSQRSGKGMQRRIAFESLALGLSILIAAGYGLFRLHSAGAGRHETGRPLAVALVQGNTYYLLRI